MNLLSKFPSSSKLYKREGTDTYTKLDFSSRDALRKRVEHLATRLKLPENLIANGAVELVHEFLETIENNEAHPYPRQAYLAYYLLEPKGMENLRNALKKCGKPKPMPETHIMQRPTSSYFNMIGGTFAVFLLLFTVIIGWNSGILTYPMASGPIGPYIPCNGMGDYWGSLVY